MKAYINPEVEIMIFSSQDIISLSGVDATLDEWDGELDGENYSF